jgi:hypothetical protein
MGFLDFECTRWWLFQKTRHAHYVFLTNVRILWHYGVHRNTIQSLLRQSGNTKGRQRPGLPLVTSRQQDNHIRMVHLRDRFQTSILTVRSIPGLRPISSRTVRNRLRDRHIRSRRSVICPILLPMHRAARMTSCEIQKTELGQYSVYRWIPFALRQQWWLILSLPPRKITLFNVDSLMEADLWCGEA